MLEKDITEGEYFRVDGGPVLPSLVALRAYLRTIPAKQFEHHVTVERNDFANWVEHVFGETALASALRSCRSREQMVWALDDAFAEARMAKVLADQEIRPVSQKQVAGALDAEDAPRLEDDGAFEPYKKEITDNNEHISAKYEQIAKQMQEAIADVMPKEIEQRIERLKNRQQDLQAKISEARKLGKDMLIPMLVMRQFVAKLKYASISRDEKDFAAAEQVLGEVKDEFDEAAAQQVVDVRKEVLALAEQPVK
jgi:hypothetical protein